MTEAAIDSDKGIGVTFALAAVALVGAAAMYGYPTQLGKAWGFAAALVFGVLAVAAVQALE